MSPAIEWSLMVGGWTVIFIIYLITRYKITSKACGIYGMETNEMLKENMLANIIFIFYFLAAGVVVHVILIPDFIQYEFFAHYFHFVLGIIIFSIATWLYAVSRITLGKCWTPRGELLRDPSKLEKSGAYAVIRHPSYSALILAGFASGIMIATSRVLFFMILMIPIIYWRVKIEEHHLEQIFPEYKDYKKKTRMFF